MAASPWAPLRNRVFRALFVAQIASNIGTLMHGVGAIWLMGDLDSSPSLVALVQTSTFLPVFLVGIPAGAVADLVDRRRLLLTTQAAMMATAVVLALLAFRDDVTTTSLLGLTFLLGLAGAFNQPAWQSIQPELVPRDQLPQAIALSNTSFNLGRAIGPAIGGLIVARGGPEWVFLLNGASFLLVMTVLFLWRFRRAESSLPPETLTGATRAGLRYGMNSPALRHVLLRSFVLIFPGSAILSLMPVVARGPLRLGSGGFGVLLACFGFGAAVSAVFRPRIMAAVSVDRLMLVTSLVLAAFLLVAATVHDSFVLGGTLIVTGGAWTLAVTATGVAAQAALPDWVRGRGLALWNLAIVGGLAIGSAVWGAVASWSLDWAHVIAAATLLVLFAATSRSKLSTSERVDVSLARLDDPVITLSPEATDGPVLITIRYRVVDGAYEEFIADMRLVERQRRRTGAYRWGLFRDLADPETVLESYLVESWAEHLRQHHRTTSSDVAVLGRARRHVTESFEIAHLISCYTDPPTRGRAARDAVGGDSKT